MTGPQDPRTGLKWLDGTGYDDHVGTWSRMVASTFVDWLASPTGARWIDIGCGTGALSSVVLSRADASTLHGVDPAAGYIEHALATVGDPRARFSMADAEHLPFDDDTYDIAVSGLVLNFVADPSVALAEQVRVVRPGGMIAAYVWDYAKGLEFLRSFWQAAVAVDPAAKQREREASFPIAAPGPLGVLFEEGRLGDISVRSIEVVTRFDSFDELWGRFLGATRLQQDEEPVWKGPSYDLLASVDEAVRDEIRGEFRKRLPAESDGSLRLQARAWAIKGATPS